MILYKYRSLENLEHVLDIILNQRLYCSTYPELNVPFEGLFITTTTFKATYFQENEIIWPIFAKLPIQLKKIKAMDYF